MSFEFMYLGVRMSSRSNARQDGFQLTRRALGRSVALGTLGAVLWPNAAASAMQAAMPARRQRPSDAELKSLIRIGANENPYGVGPMAAEAIRNNIVAANRYPGEATMTLTSTLAKFHDVPMDWIALSPGSGDVLRAVTLTFTSPSLALVGAAPTFEAPARIAEMTGATVRAPQVLANGQLDLKAMAAQAAGAGLLYVCNPNNPTGSIVSAAAVADFVAQVRKVNADAYILIDEAYSDLVDDPGFASATPLLKNDKKIVVSRTFSKIHGMAGLRVGYAIAQPDTLYLLRKNLSMGNIAVTSIAAATASMNDTENMKKQKALNRSTRAATGQAFEKAGFTVLPSEANFIMVDIKKDVREYQNACRQAGVMIARPFPPLNTYARITIGTVEEMQKATPILVGLLQQPAKPATPTSAALYGADEPLIVAANMMEIPGYPACC
jgi:histidinol-phosphate aminotransferase